MKPRTALGMLIASLLIATLIAPSAVAAPNDPAPALTLGVTLSFAPNPVSVGSQTQIQISISGGTSPYYVWFNGTIPGCNPPQQPMQQNSSSVSYSCNPTSTGNYPVSLGVADSAGNHGSGGATLNVQSTGGSGGSGTGGNGSSPIDLSFLNNLLPIVMITGILFLGSVVAIAASAVSLAILVPRRLKQIRKALEGEPMKKPKASKDEAPSTLPPPPQTPPSNEEL